MALVREESVVGDDVSPVEVVSDGWGMNLGSVTSIVALPALPNIERAFAVASRNSRVGSSSADRNSACTPWLILRSSPYNLPARRNMSGSFSGPSTTSPMTRMKSTSLPERLNTVKSYEPHGAALSTLHVMQQRLPPLRRSPLLVARGGAAEYVASSIVESCAVALRLGADGLDLDVVNDANGLRVRPRSAPVRFSRRTAVPDASWDDLVAALPQDGVTVILRADVAEHDDIRRNLANHTSTVHPWFIVGSSNGDPKADLLANSPTFVRGSLASMPAGIERFCAETRNAGRTGIVLDDNDWTGGIVAVAHRFGLEAMVENVVQEHRMVTLLRMGIDVLSSAWPDRMASARAEHERLIARES